VVAEDKLVRDYTLDLEASARVVAWMREHGVIRMRIGYQEYELGPAPSAKTEAPPPPTEAELVQYFRRQKEENEALLFASSEGFPEHIEP
jgi:hypothetical protein